MFEHVLTKFGLNEKEIRVYMSLLSLGTASVRTIAEHAQINRTTTHDILGKLINEGLVTYVDKQKHRSFIAEHPEQLMRALKIKKEQIESVESEISHAMPELKLLYERSETSAHVKYFEGVVGLRAILEDVLQTVSRANEKKYYVYSSSSIRDLLYAAYPNYNNDRVKKGISVQTISIGKGGILHGMDERKWLTQDEKGSPTYTLLYCGKVALISYNQKNEPQGVVVVDDNTYQTQKIIFAHMWNKLKSE